MTALFWWATFGLIQTHYLGIIIFNLPSCVLQPGCFYVNLSPNFTWVGIPCSEYESERRLLYCPNISGNNKQYLQRRKAYY